MCFWLFVHLHWENAYLPNLTFEVSSCGQVTAPVLPLGCTVAVDGTCSTSPTAEKYREYDTQVLNLVNQQKEKKIVIPNESGLCLPLFQQQCSDVLTCSS